MSMVINLALMSQPTSPSLGRLKCNSCGYEEGLDADGIIGEVLASGKRRKRWWQFWKKG